MSKIANALVTAVAIIALIMLFVSAAGAQYGPDTSDEIVAVTVTRFAG